jgi:hypothetical protein
MDSRLGEKEVISEKSLQEQGGLAQTCIGLVKPTLPTPESLEGQKGLATLLKYLIELKLYNEM